MPHTNLLAALLAFFILPAKAISPEPQPGNYFRENDSGILIIKKDRQNVLKFEIESQGGNCHSCLISGSIRATKGTAEDSGDSRCEISFQPSRLGLVVTPVTEEVCRGYCGMRAGFDGIYRLPPTLCTSAIRQTKRDQFLALYGAGRYAFGASLLQTLISTCKDFMGWIEIDQVRNDLALSQ